MRTWVFRHRHALRALYGLPPEARLARLMDSESSTERPPQTPGRSLESAPRPPESTQPEPGLLRPRRRRA